MPDLFDGVVDSLYPEWHARRACHTDELERLGLTPDAFFPNGYTRIDPRAAALCARCPVATECGEEADASNEQWGIWAGVFRETTPEVAA